MHLETTAFNIKWKVVYFQVFFLIRMQSTPLDVSRLFRGQKRHTANVTRRARHCFENARSFCQTKQKNSLGQK